MRLRTVLWVSRKRTVLVSSLNGTGLSTGYYIYVEWACYFTFTLPLFTQVWVSLHTSLSVHWVGAYLGFLSMKQLGVFLFPSGWDASPSQDYPTALNTLVPICSPSWREEPQEQSILPKKNNALSWPVLEPGRLVRKCNTLTIRSPCLRQKIFQLLIPCLRHLTQNHTLFKTFCQKKIACWGQSDKIDTLKPQDFKSCGKQFFGSIPRDHGNPFWYVHIIYIKDIFFEILFKFWLANLNVNLPTASSNFQNF